MNEYVVIWSPLAEKTYFKILENILERWSVSEAEDFETKVNSLLEKLKTHKYLCPLSFKQKSLRRCVITPRLPTRICMEYTAARVEAGNT